MKSSEPLPLLRVEPLAYRRGEAGEVFRHGRALPAAIFAVLAAVFVLGVAYALGAPLARTVTVAGTIEPVAGLIELFVRQRGTVVRLHVVEGEHVDAGASLVTVRRRHGLAGIDDVSRALTERLARQQQLVGKELSAAGARHDLEMARLTRRHARAEARLAYVELEREALARRLANKRGHHERLERALATGAIPEIVVQRAEDEVLAAEQATARLDAERAAVAAEVDDLALAREESGAAFRRLRFELVRQRDELARRMLVARSAAAEVIRAPRAATVAIVAVSLGVTAVPEEPVITLLPAGGLEATLWVDSRAAGFVTAGDGVRLMVDAFPFHEHGGVDGVVEAVSPVPAVRGESIYRLDVALGAVPPGITLRPGMTVTADLNRGSRTLWERVTEPLLRASRRL